MRKSVGGTLYQAREHLGVQIPVLGFVLGAEDAALGGPFETLLEFLRIDAPEKLLEGGPGGGERCGVLCLELAEVLRIASTDPARVDKVVSKRTMASSTPREKFSGDSGPSLAGGEMRKRLRNSLRLWFKSINPRTASRSSWPANCSAAERASVVMLCGSMPAPRQKAASPKSKSPS